jgi:hypothetical protein
MGFLRRVFGGPSPHLVEFPVWILKPDRADAIINVVGESFHQDALLVISGGRTLEEPAPGHAAVWRGPLHGHIPTLADRFGTRRPLRNRPARPAVVRYR